MDEEEMQAKGWEQDDKGRWTDPARTAQTRDYFRHTATPCPEGPNSPSEDSDEEEAA
jgi:hypothetical protein